MHRRTEELPVESVVWNSWKSKSLSFMLDLRSTRLVSGASLIYSAPESQWIQMFERLNISADDDDNLHETIELLLFGCIAANWNTVIEVEHMMKISYRPCTISSLYHDVFNLQPGRSHNLFPKEKMDTKERNVVNFLESLVKNRINLLWKLSPVILAVAIPTCTESISPFFSRSQLFLSGCRSQLFRSYLLDLEGQLTGCSSASRCCNCLTNEVAHRTCEHLIRLIRFSKFLFLVNMCCG
ncbi:uncharacterized protein [Henckelia pumila]|uniref:uncharacterized protein isoform X2 n=1 Tax=Henckelia pumila TaxID=405737 RepID=UPI003C6DC50D